MIKYLIGTVERMEELTIAYDKANGLMAADGTPTPKRARIFRNGVDVTGDPRYDPNEHGIFVGTTTVFGAPITSPDIPGEAALRYDAPSEEVDPWHGLTVAGTVMPDEFEWLVESELPPRWRAVFFPAPIGPPGEDPPEASATIRATVQMRDEDGDGELEPHLDVTVEHDEAEPGSVAARVLSKLTGRSGRGHAYGHGKQKPKR